MGIPLCVICCFSLAAFNICSLCLIFVNLINMCLVVFHLGFILFGTLWVSWTCVIISFPILGKISTIISSSIFSWSFFLSSSSGTPMSQTLEYLKWITNGKGREVGLGFRMGNMCTPVADSC